MAESFADQITAALQDLRVQGLGAEPVSMRATLAEDANGLLAVVAVLLSSGEVLRFTTREGLRDGMH